MSRNRTRGRGAGRRRALHAHLTRHSDGSHARGNPLGCDSAPSFVLSLWRCSWFAEEAGNETKRCSSSSPSPGCRAPFTWQTASGLECRDEPGDGGRCTTRFVCDRTPDWDCADAEAVEPMDGGWTPCWSAGPTGRTLDGGTKTTITSGTWAAFRACCSGPESCAVYVRVAGAPPPEEFVCDTAAEAPPSPLRCELGLVTEP